MARTRVVAVTDEDGNPILGPDGEPILTDKVRIWPQLFLEPEFYDQVERWAAETRGKTVNKALRDLIMETVEPLVAQHIAAHPTAPAKVRVAKTATKAPKTPEELAKAEAEKQAKKQAAATAAAERQQKSEALRRAQAEKASAAAKAAAERATAKRAEGQAQAESAGDAAAQRAAKQAAARSKQEATA